MKTTVCAADSGGVNFSVFFRGCCNCLLTTTRQLHKNAEKFVACCVRAAQLAKLATCFTACHEFMHTAPFFSPAQHLTELVSIAHFSNASWKFWFFSCFPLSFLSFSTRTKPKSKPVNNESNLSWIRLDPKRFLSLSRIGLQFVGQVERENVAR